MNTVEKAIPVKELISKLRQLDVLVTLADGELDIEAPEAVLTEELLAEIRAGKQELMEVLAAYHGKQQAAGEITPLSEQPSYALSSPQRRIWILSQFEAINVAYNMPGIYTFKGSLDIAVFRAAFAAVIARHETLRTVFKENEQQEVRQYIQQAADSGFAVTYVDLQHTEDAPARLTEALEELVVKAFDITNGPLLRAALFQLEARKHIFFFNMHHIISDGWSMGVLIRDVVLYYNALLKGGLPDLPDLTIQYKDYAAWQWKQLSGKNMEAHRNYWLGQFNDDIPLLDLPIAQVRPALKTNHGAMVNGSLPAAVVNSLRDMIKPEGGTLFMGLLAGVKALLYRYSGQEDIVIGSPVAGRDNKELDDQIGFYINTLALRTRFSGTADFKTLYRQVKEVTLAGFKHQLYPFDELVETLNLKRDLSRSALFDVMVAIQNNEEEARTFRLGEVEIAQYPIHHVTSKYDLIFNFTEAAGGVQYTIEYNTDLYTAESIVRMRIHFENLMAFAVNNSQVPLNRIDLLGEAEHTAWRAYNETAIAYPERKTLTDLFIEQVNKTPHHTALLFEDKAYTYQQLYTKAARLAHHLRTKGNQLNRAIPIVAGKSAEQIWGVLGILMAGAHYIPIKGDLPEARIQELIIQSAADLVLVQPALQHKVHATGSVQLVALCEDTISAEPELQSFPAVKETDLAYIIFTSGSTGKPKGVMIDHRGAVNTLYDINARFEVTEKDVVFGISDLSFDLSVYDIFGTFAAGATLVLPKDEDVQDPDAWLGYVARHQVTVWDSVPQLVSLLVDAQKGKAENLLASLRIYFMSGDWIPVDLPARIRAATPDAAIISMGGATEGSIWSIYYPVHDVNPQWKSIPYGYPLGNQQMYILNDAQELCPFMVPGHVYIGGKGVAKGYYKDEEKTAASFTTHAVRKELYRTGDYGVFHPDGYINFLGRQDGQVKIRGYRIEMGEVESVLNNHPLIDQCIVATTPPEGKDRLLVAYIVSRETLHSNELAAYAGSLLPQYMVPSYFVQLPQLPLTANGKVDKKALPDPAVEKRSGETAYQAPRNEAEMRLAAIWSNVLGIDTAQIGINDNFFELGGHSLRVTQLKSLIQQAFQVNFKINELFTHVSISDQVRLVGAAASLTYTAIPRVAERPYYLLSSSQRRLWVLSQFEATNIAYNIPLAFTLEGVLQPALLQEVLQGVIARHEILRTVFSTQEDGEVYQEIKEVADSNCTIRYIDLQTEQHQAVALNNALRAAARQPFDLANGPLLAVSVYLLGNNRQVLFVNMHHIIGDGWSLEVLLKEVLLSYNSKWKGIVYEPDTLAVQYRDYAHWQRQQLTGTQLEVHRNWWLKQFAGELPVPAFPAAYPRPAVQTHRGAVMNGVIAARTARGFKQLMQQQETTLFMGLLAAIKTLVYRYTGAEDVIIGSPVAGREHKDLDNQIGLYIGMLALRTRFNGKESFAHLLQQVKTVALGAYEHQLYPFDELVAALDLKRDTSRSALFDIVVILHNNNRLSEAIEGSGLDRKPYEFEQTASKFDITFNFAEVADTIEYAVEYNTDIYSAEQMNRLAVHLQHLLESIVANSSLALHQLNYLDKEEQEQLLVGFNTTDGDGVVAVGLMDRFEQQVQRNADAAAVVFRNKTLSYQQLQQQAQQLAVYLQQQGVTKGALVGVFLERSEQLPVVLLAIWLAGAVYVPLDPAYPEDRIAFVINDAGINTVVTQAKLADKLSVFNGNLIRIDSRPDALPAGRLIAIQSTDTAYVIYTSGSTGKPKGVEITHGNIAAFLLGMDKEIDAKAGDSLLAITTISFDISVLELFWTLANGMKVVIQPSQYLGPVAPDASTKKMDFSLFYFASEVNDSNKYQLLLEGARFADEHGFTAIWTPERHFHEFGGIYPNPAITGAAIATITKNIQIRSGSCVLPLHNPIRVAEEWSVVDNLSGGRVGLSFATGWVMNDFLAFAPDSYNNRYELLYQGIAQVQQLWKGEPFTLSNATGNDAVVEIYPKPVQKELPVWITAAGSPETFRAAGEQGANLLTHLLGQTVEELKDKIALYRAARRQAGYAGEGHVTLMIHTFVAENREMVKEKVRTPFRNYLANSVGLLRSLGKSIGQDVDDQEFRTEDMTALLDHAFDRYFDTAALFGTPESCLTMVNRLSHAGVDELGCLVDFGLDFNTAFGGLQHLHTLQQAYAAQAEARAERHSLAALIAQHQVTHLQCTPSALKIMLQEEAVAQQAASLKHLMVGGEALPLSLAQEVHNTLQVQLHNMYGPTETTVWSATANIEKEAAAITIGKPIANTQLYILDAYRNIVPVGVDGEIYIGGAGVAKGYLHRPELTAERFVPHPYQPGALLYRTGDMGRWRADGSLLFAGRKDDQVKVRGHRIEPGEIETVLKRYDTITDVIVTTFVNNSQDTELVAYITGSTAHQATALRNFLAQRLPAYMIPTHFVQLESWPLTPNGKINRKALPAPQGAGMGNGTPYTAPRNEEEMRLAEAWGELLEKDKNTIGIHDNFFELGGQSLSAIRLMGIISKELNMRIPLSLIFENPTIYEFMGWLNMYRDTLQQRPSDITMEIEEVL